MQSTKHNSEEAGIVLIVVAFLIVALITLAAIVMNRGYSSIIVSELQAAADASAHSGASTMCSSATCYADVVPSVIATLNNLITHGNLGEDSNFGTAIDITFPGGPTWENAEQTLRVTIQRGRWWPNSIIPPANVHLASDIPNFEPFDRHTGITWQNEYPGIPEFLAANAVRVTIERKEIGFLLSLFSGDTYSKIGDSVAIGGLQGITEVAPFAIPACALLDQNGNYHRRRNCSQDRHFTRADRYCTDPADNDDCNVLPGAQYNIRMIGECEGTLRPWWPEEGFWQDCDWTEFGNLTSWSDLNAAPRCAWVSGRYNDVRDHFGVLGVPNSINATESSIRTKINSANPLYIAKIGDTFAILPNGLQESDSELALANQLNDEFNLGVCKATSTNPTACDGLPEETLRESSHFFLRHPYNWEYFGPVQPSEHRLDINNSYPEQCGCSDASLNKPSSEYANNNDPFDPNYIPTGCTEPCCGSQGLHRPPLAGACNSLIGSFYNGHKGQIINNTSEWTAAGSCKLNNPIGGLIDNIGSGPQTIPRVWRVNIPVIADTRDITQATAGNPIVSCQGINGGTDEPSINSGGAYNIIGFIEANIFDADIGNAPMQIVNIGTSEPECDDLASRFPTSAWGFQGPPNPATGVVTSCNSVRARLTCKPGLIASIEHTGPRSVTIVH